MFSDAWADRAEKFSPAEEVVGCQIERLGRAGKYLIFGLDDGRELIAHLGMTGAFLVVPAGQRLELSQSHIRAHWRLDDAGGGRDRGDRDRGDRGRRHDQLQLAYRDIRRFGRLRVVPAGCYRSAPTLFAQGPDALSDEFTPQHLHQALKRSRRPIKTQLLSQRPVAGLGNIYADEALWESRISPVARQLGRQRCERLHEAIGDVLGRALESGGTTLQDYRLPDETTGYFQRELRCYGRAGEPCLRCGDPLRRKVIDARSACWCPRCQR